MSGSTMTSPWSGPAAAARSVGAIVSTTATHAISDARVTHREEIGFRYVVFGAAVCNALVPVVAKLAGT